MTSWPPTLELIKASAARKCCASFNTGTMIEMVGDRVMILEALPKPELTMAMKILGHQQGALTGDRACDASYE